VKKRPWQTCNVFSAGPDGWRLWRFQRAKGGVTLEREEQGEAEQGIPGNLATRSLRHLWQPLINVAWLPPETVFLRVIELPAGDPAEAPMMVGFELERLSPLPVADIYWTCEVLPGDPGRPLTVIVIMAAREAVEACVRRCEQTGCVPDRIELPLVRELLECRPETDGAWLLLRREGDQITCLLAWWADGRPRHVALEQFADTDADAPERLARLARDTAWAGELEGWHGPRTRWHLVADEGLAARFGESLRAVAPELEIRPPLALADLAGRCAASDTRANFLPEEARARHRQQFIDRLWMRALSTAALVYVFGVLAYFAFLNIQNYRKDNIEYEIALMHQSYTNALALKAKVAVLRNQIELKFAALDCLKATADNLPPELTLSSFSFQHGQRLTLVGTVPTSDQAKVAEFTEALSRAELHGRRLFSKVSTKSIQARPNRPANWSIACELERPQP